MKRIFHYLLLFGLLLVFVGSLIFLYFKSQGVDNYTYGRVNYNLRMLKQLDAEWNVHVLRPDAGDIKAGRHINPEKMFLALERDLGTLSDQVADNNRLLPKLSEYREAVFAKSRLLGEKSGNRTIFQQNLTDLPSTIEQLQQTAKTELLSGNSSDVVLTEAEIEKITRKNPEKRSLQKLTIKSNQLLAEIFKFNLTPVEAQQRVVEQQLLSLAVDMDQYSESLRKQLIDVLQQSRGLLEQKTEQEMLLQKLRQLPTTRLNEELGELSSQYFGSKLVEQNQYRKYLILYAGLLLLLLVYFVYRLLRAFAALRKANENLEARVDERTHDLNQAVLNLKESQSQLLQSEKMASLGQMVAGITHEINTPLAYVKSGLEIIHSRTGDLSELVQANLALNQVLDADKGEEHKIGEKLQQVGEISEMLKETETMEETEELLTDSLHGIEQISEIVSNLKNFSRLDRAQVSAFNVNDGLESTLKIARHLTKTRTLEKNYGQVPVINGSPSAINQVFLNLISNAVQATDEGGLIELSTNQHGDSVRITVTDDGCGIPQTVIDKIFDPFYTTKDIGQGTGLGLSIVKRIVDEHQGQITIQSEEGKGTCFIIDLPVGVALEECDADSKNH